jgi:selenide,water dikinase
MIVTNRGSMPGDVLVLTKPLGTGIHSTALKQGLLEAGEADLLGQTMAALNKGAALAMQEVGVSACTDVTGFGLMGHLLEMMKASGTSAIVDSGKVPMLPRTLEMAASGVVPGGTRNNYDYTAPFVEYGEEVPEVKRLLLNDAQTSGGLLISVAETRLDSLMDMMSENGVMETAPIGRVLEEQTYRIAVR